MVVTAAASSTNPAKVLICHCTDCQTLSGSAFRTVVPTLKGTFKLPSGQPKVYVKTGDSGNDREQTFCADCGTPIYSGPTGLDRKVLSLRVGSLRQRDQLVPSDQFWFRSAQEWLPQLKDMPKKETQPVFSSGGSFRS